MITAKYAAYILRSHPQATLVRRADDPARATVYKTNLPFPAYKISGKELEKLLADPRVTDCGRGVYNYQ